MAQILELPDKDFKAAIIKMLQSAIIDSWKNEERIGRVSKVTEDTKKIPMEILELKKYNSQKFLKVN